MKKELTTIKYIKGFLLTAAVLLVLCAGTVILFDPFFHYHKPLPFLKAVLWEKEYQVPGTLDHFDYDAVIAGSSVAENYNNHWFDENFSCTSVKAIRSYGATADLCYFVNRAFEHQDLTYVFFNIDPSSLIQDPNTTFEQTGSPMYLYDQNPINDVKYLWNKDVLFERIPYMIASSFMKDYDEGASYNWAQWKAFNEDTILYHYIRSNKYLDMKPDEEYMDICKENLSLIEDILNKHPETTFYIFIPPYSILWWDNLYHDGDTSAYLYTEQYAMTKLINYPNVRLFNFQNAEDIIYNLDNYTDTLHFSPEINKYMCDCLMNGTYELKTEDEIANSILDIRKYALDASSYTDKNYGDRIKVQY